MLLVKNTCQKQFLNSEQPQTMLGEGVEINFYMLYFSFEGAIHTTRAALLPCGCPELLCQLSCVEVEISLEASKLWAWPCRFHIRVYCLHLRIMKQVRT